MKKLLQSIKPMQIIMYLALVAAVLFAVIVFVAFREEIDTGTLDQVKSLFLRDGGGENAEPFRFDPGAQNRYEIADGRLAVLSPDRFAFYDRDGSERYSESLSYEIPALTRAGDKVIAYDRMGAGCLIANRRGILSEITDPVLTAAGNDRGQYILVTKENEYRSVARLYSRQDKPAYAWKSTRYIMAAGLSPLGTRMAVASIGAGGDLAETRLTFLSAGEETPLAEISLPDTLPWGIFYPDNSHVCIITETLVYFYTDTGVLLGEYTWPGETLLRYSASSDALFLQIGRYDAGQYSRVVMLEYQGTILDNKEFDEGLTALSSAGSYVSFLEDETVTRYTVTPQGMTDPIKLQAQARELRQQADGGLLLLFSDYARWETPGS